jgi:hypothetical protein
LLNFGFGDWSELDHWEVEGPPGTWSKPTKGQGVPGPGDIATIRANHFFDVDQEVTIESLTIEALGVLSFDGEHTLEVTGVGGLTIERLLLLSGHLFVDIANCGLLLTGGGEHTVDGELYVTAEEAFVEVRDADCTIGGEGGLRLWHSGGEAQLRIVGSRRLTIGKELTLSGAGKIIRNGGDGEAYFCNQGTVAVDTLQVNGALSFFPDVYLEDSPGAQWCASGSAGTLQFMDQSAGPCLAGDFYLMNGATITANVRLDTAGIFVCSGGGVVSGIYYNCDCDDDHASCTKAVGCQ